MLRQPDPVIEKAIRACQSDLYPRWFPELRKWIIVKDYHRRIPGVTYYDPATGKHYIVEIILEDEQGRGLELDPRIVPFIRQTLYEKNNLWGSGGFDVDKMCSAIDDEEFRRRQAGVRFRHNAVCELFKKLWKFKTKQTFVYGGTS
jgi:hypothetical protein